MKRNNEKSKAHRQRAKNQNWKTRMHEKHSYLANLVILYHDLYFFWRKMNIKLDARLLGLNLECELIPYQEAVKIRMVYTTWIMMEPSQRGTDMTYQITEASKSNFIKGQTSPPNNEISIKITEETRKPSHHNFVDCPPFHKLSQHKFIMLLF